MAHIPLAVILKYFFHCHPYKLTIWKTQGVSLRLLTLDFLFKVDFMSLSIPHRAGKQRLLLPSTGSTNRERDSSGKSQWPVKWNEILEVQWGKKQNHKHLITTAICCIRTSRSTFVNRQKNLCSEKLLSSVLFLQICILIFQQTNQWSTEWKWLSSYYILIFLFYHLWCAGFSK